MDWQQLMALGIVGVTTGLLVRAKLLSRRKFSFERDTHCGCSGAASSRGQKSSIVFRARKGGGREVMVKMK